MFIKLSPIICNIKDIHCITKTTETTCSLSLKNNDSLNYYNLNMSLEEAFKLISKENYKL